MVPSQAGPLFDRPGLRNASPPASLRPSPLGPAGAGARRDRRACEWWPLHVITHAVSQGSCKVVNALVRPPVTRR